MWLVLALKLFSRICTGTRHLWTILAQNNSRRFKHSASTLIVTLRNRNISCRVHSKLKHIQKVISVSSHTFIQCFNNMKEKKGKTNHKTKWILKTARLYKSHTFPNLDLDIASSVADSASCMTTEKKKKG